MPSTTNRLCSRRLIAILGVVATALLVAPDLLAQTLPNLGQLTARQRADLNQLNTSEDLDNPLYISVGDDQDENIGTIKILREGQSYRPLRFHFSSDWFWTDNAALTPKGIPQLSDNYLASEIGVSYVPRLASPFPEIGTDLYGEFTAAFGMFRYDHHSFLDFNSVDLGVGLIQVFRGWGDLSIYGRYAYEGLINPDHVTTFFDEHSAVFGFYKPFDIIPGHYFYIRGESEFSLDTNPSIIERNEYSSTFGYRYFHTQKLHADLYYRLRYLDFRNIFGNDWNHQVGLGLSYELNEFVSFGAAWNVAVNDSDRVFGSYTAHAIGGSIFLQIRM